VNLTLHKLIGNDTLFAAAASATFVMLHVLAVQTSSLSISTFVGPEVVGIFPAIAEVFIIVGLCWRLGSLAGIAVIFTSYALGLALAAPGDVIPTTVSKLAVVAFVAPLMPHWRHWHPMSLLIGMCGLAMAIETFAFAATYGHLELIPASLFIKALFMIAAVVIFGARRPRGAVDGGQQGHHDLQTGPAGDFRNAGTDRLEPVPTDG
jgi:hypothetical protein